MIICKYLIKKNKLFVSCFSHDLHVQFVTVMSEKPAPSLFIIYLKRINDNLPYNLTGLGINQWASHVRKIMFIYECQRVISLKN